MTPREPEPFKPRAPHHLYVGVVLIFFAWLMQGAWWPSWCYYFFYAAGAGIAADDIYEHRVSGRTPLRWFFERVLLPRLK